LQRFTDRWALIAEASNESYTNRGTPIIGRGVNDDPWSDVIDPKSYYGNYNSAYAFAAQVAEVEVDTDTGIVKVVKLTCAHDVGRTINPLLARGQVVGGVLRWEWDNPFRKLDPRERDGAQSQLSGL
jgi:CO/xanthine dehydrogenase Mo-binding subunit